MQRHNKPPSTTASVASGANNFAVYQISGPSQKILPQKGQTVQRMGDSDTAKLKDQSTHKSLSRSPKATISTISDKDSASNKKSQAFSLVQARDRAQAKKVELKILAAESQATQNAQVSPLNENSGVMQTSIETRRLEHSIPRVKETFELNHDAEVQAED